MNQVVRIGKDVEITREDVLRAIDYYDREDLSAPGAKSGFFMYNGKEYPARKLGILALSLRVHKDAKDIRFHGGEYAVKYMERLGFEGRYVEQ